MKNRQFHFRLRQLKGPDGKAWTVGKIAAAIYVNRPHLTDVLNNKNGHGFQTRPKVIQFFKGQFPDQWLNLLAALQWSEDGKILPEPNVGRPTIGST